MDRIDIRIAQEADLCAILSLYGQLEVDNGQVLTAEAALEIFKKMASYPDYHLYVAEKDGEVMGTFALLIMDNLAHMGDPSAVIEDVAVDPARQGQGIGKQMMQFALELCNNIGCYKVALSSNLKRESAHKFYESLGFVKHGYSFLCDIKK